MSGLVTVNQAAEHVSNILSARHFEAILAATLISEIGLHFFKSLLSLPFFSINVLIACVDSVTVDHE